MRKTTILLEFSDFIFEALQRGNARRLSTLLPSRTYFKKSIETLLVERHRELYFW